MKAQESWCCSFNEHMHCRGFNSVCCRSSGCEAAEQNLSVQEQGAWSPPAQTTRLDFQEINSRSRNVLSPSHVGPYFLSTYYSAVVLMEILGWFWFQCPPC